MSAQERSFPLQLLSDTVDARVQYFRDKVFQHTHFDAAYAQLMRTLRYAEKDTLVLVYGPPRVGKSTLLNQVEKALNKDYREAMSQNPGIIPVVATESICQGNFDWKDFHKRLLQAAQEPPELIDQKRDPDRLTSSQDARGHRRVRCRGTGSDLRWAVEECFRQRQVRTLLIDEAHHLTFTPSGRYLHTQMETLKSFTSVTGTTQVLFGTYTLLALRELGAQLSCRTTEIHLPRYHLRTPMDPTTFRGIVRTFQRSLPLVEAPDLVSDWEFCYARSLGCIGILHPWLTRALVAVLEAKQETLTKSILEKTALSKEHLTTILREIREGEDKLNRPEPSDSDFRALVGLPSGGPASNGSPQAGPQPEVPSPKPRRRRVGERKPTRDPVGGTRHVA